MTIKRIDYNGATYATLRNVTDAHGAIYQYTPRYFVRENDPVVYTLVHFTDGFGQPLAVTIPMDGRLEVSE
jgi:hypothetical protein